MVIVLQVSLNYLCTLYIKNLCTYAQMFVINAAILDVQVQNGCLLKRSLAMIKPLHAEFDLTLSPPNI